MWNLERKENRARYENRRRQLGKRKGTRDWWEKG
jgi:hypothetical protein